VHLRPALAGLLASALLAFASPPARAEPREFVSLTIENDFFAGYDRHYTNGTQLAFLAGDRTVVALGQRIYTPANTDVEVPDPRDRPYAGWLYGMADWRVRDDVQVVDHLTFTAGLIGPASGARQAQDLAHRVLGEDRSRGWRSQLHDEPTFMIAFERAWPSIAAGTIGNHRWDASLRASGSVGTPLTYANAGAVIRYGSRLPRDLPVTHISLGPSRDGFRGTMGRGWYVWGGVDGHAVARNTFIEGNTFRDSPGVGREPFGYDLQIGIAAVWPGARIGFTVVERSAEYRGQGGHDRFGQLALSFAY
jgi:hypothetical protein